MTLSRRNARAAPHYTHPRHYRTHLPGRICDAWRRHNAPAYRDDVYRLFTSLPHPAPPPFNPPPMRTPTPPYGTTHSHNYTTPPMDGLGRRLPFSTPHTRTPKHFFTFAVRTARAARYQPRTWARTAPYAEHITQHLRAAVCTALCFTLTSPRITWAAPVRGFSTALLPLPPPPARPPPALSASALRTSSSHRIWNVATHLA